MSSKTEQWIKTIHEKNNSWASSRSIKANFIFQNKPCFSTRLIKRFQTQTQSDKRIQHQTFKQQIAFTLWRNRNCFSTNFYDFSNFPKSTKNILLWFHKFAIASNNKIIFLNCFSSYRPPPQEWTEKQQKSFLKVYFRNSSLGTFEAKLSTNLFNCTIFLTRVSFY